MDQSDAVCSESWNSPPAILKPPRDQVHLWRMLLDVLPADAASLAPDERERAEKLIHLQNRQRFVAMRAAARSVLGRYLQIAPNSIVFAYGDKGKPSLAKEQNDLDLRFNLSHSRSLGILAVACHCEVGVDVETRTEVFDYMAIARRFFAPREHRALAALPEELRQQGFLRCWTRKESYIKALGKGLAYSLQSFSVSASPAITNDALLETKCPIVFHVSDVVLPEECYAALTLEGDDRSRRCWTYQP